VHVFEGFPELLVLLCELLIVGPQLLSVEGVDIGRVSLVKGLLDGPQVVPDGGSDDIRRC
jgi:hypothetical protein